MTRNRATSHLAPDPGELARLVAGVHHDPHSILGAHEYGEQTVIRALRPVSYTHLTLPTTPYV